jgi:hypothetical protein
MSNTTAGNPVILNKVAKSEKKSKSEGVVSRIAHYLVGGSPINDIASFFQKSSKSLSTTDDSESFVEQSGNFSDGNGTMVYN